MKSTFFQEYLVILGAVTFVLAGMLSAFGNPAIAIVLSFLISLNVCRIGFNKLWKNEGEILDQPYYEIESSWKKWTWSIIVSAILSQMGWCALLV